MLVLSRRESEKILFPTLGISVEVLRIRGNKARLGIDAPADIPVLRHEIPSLKEIEFTPDKSDANRQLRDLYFAIRNRLSSATNELNQLHTNLEGHDTACQQIILNLYRELCGLEDEANKVLEGTGILINNPSQALLVEDSIVEQKLLGGYLELCGFEVITANDGRDALDYLSLHSRPDVVLLDMLMPRINGREFVKTVRNDPRMDGLAIFAVSSKSRTDVDVRIGQGGVDRWIKKPFSPQKLVAEIAQYLTDRAVAA